MRFPLRVAAHAIAFAALVLLIVPAAPAWLWAIEAATLAALFVLHLGRLRPWSDLAAWAGTLAALALLPVPDLSPIAVAGLGAACVGLLGALHRPPAGVPRTHPTRALAVWGAAAAVAFALAWWPALASRGVAVAVQDPQSPAGAALRLLGAALFVAAATAVVILRAQLRWRRVADTTDDDSDAVDRIRAA